MSQFFLLLLAWSVMLLFCLSWGWLWFHRLRERRPLLPSQNRLRRVSWKFQDVALILAMFLFFPTLFMEIFAFTQSETTLRELRFPTVTSETETFQTHHPLQEFLQKNPSCWKFVFAFFFAAGIVPLTEEFVFRLVLQGWVEARERERFPAQKAGWRAVFIVAVLFSLLHLRLGTPLYPSEKAMGFQFSMSALAEMTTVLLGILLLRSTGSSWKMMGFDRTRWKSDLQLGILAFSLVALPTYCLQAFLSWLLAGICSPDAVTLLPISIVFGILYWRTKRLLPSVTVHVLLNAVSIAVAFLTLP
ncbi:MAG: CPBP family glutamic-type intramembrane protease [Planctomycetia bacterium]|nr:CPBP family glutamic-type intramembrane protease [Planctomycetia bacterium]